MNEFEQNTGAILVVYVGVKPITAVFWYQLYPLNSTDVVFFK